MHNSDITIVTSKRDKFISIFYSLEVTPTVSPLKC